MIPSESEILSDLLDGESVDAERLASILETPAGRALLVDFVCLRSEVRADTSLPGPAFYARMERAGLPAERARRIPWGLAVAASLAFAAGLGATAGFLLRRDAGPEVPPVAERTIVFEPGVNWGVEETPEDGR